MKTNEQQDISKDWKMYSLGVVLTIISAIIFALWQNHSTSEFDVFTFLHFGIFLFLIFSNSFIRIFKIRTWTSTLAIYPIIVSGFISCFALNRNVNIFYQSIPWWSYFIFLNATILLFKPILDLGGKIINTITHISLCFTCLIFLYYAILLIPIYPISLVGLIVLGLGIHAFIPLISFIYLAANIGKAIKNNDKLQRIYLYTIVFTFIAATAYVIRWTARVNVINEKTLYLELEKEKDTPKWLAVAQELPKDKLSKKVLLCSVLYPNINDFFEGGFFGFDFGSNYNIEKKHDPLILISQMFNKHINLSENEIVKILESSYDISHLTERRLWNGKDLSINTISTNVKIYPKQRLAYTEKIISIKNSNSYQFNQQEAIFTFYLPEGATVSSLSLWINGVEEKAFLTSKRKAKEAYNTIVGVESRDPSVIHWQEGNKVSVRVFPCTPNENRKFKIGITAPLTLQINQLIYSNILFKGPMYNKCKELVQIQFTDGVNDLNKPYFLKVKNNNSLLGKHIYKDWNINFNAEKVAMASFNYKDKTYQISKLNKQYETKNISNYYIDLNSSWTKEEWNKITDCIANKNIFVYYDKLIQINENNKAAVFNMFKQMTFSTFPFYKIKDTTETLVICKGVNFGPYLKELQDTKYFSKINNYFLDNKLAVYDIGNNTSPIYKTLREYRAINYDKLSVDEVCTQLKANKIPISFETDTSIAILSNNTQIVENNINRTNKNSTDNIFRLYAYNKAMQLMSIETLQNDSIAPLAYELVSDANVVSPISSLIVLETQKDYDRFDIKKDNDALENADIHNDGAVPEPHEWMLIILLLVGVIYINIKSSRYAYLFR